MISCFVGKGMENLQQHQNNPEVDISMVQKKMPQQNR